MYGSPFFHVIFRDTLKCCMIYCSSRHQLDPNATNWDPRKLTSDVPELEDPSVVTLGEQPTRFLLRHLHFHSHRHPLLLIISSLLPQPVSANERFLGFCKFTIRLQRQRGLVGARKEGKPHNLTKIHERMKLMERC